MSEDRFFEWLTQASPSQFFIGIAVLVFGSRQILSEKHVSESLSGLSWPFKVLRQRRERAAKAEAEAERALEADVQRLTRETMKYHRWMVQATDWIRRLDAWAAQNGHDLPKPDFVHWMDFETRKEPGSGDDDDDSEF